MKTGTAEKQRALPFMQMEHALRQKLEEHLGRPASLVLTDNSTGMRFCAVRNGVLTLQLHRMFLSASSDVLGEIVSYLKKQKGAMSHFRSFILLNRKGLKRKPAKKVDLRTGGRHYDLDALYDGINRCYCGGRVSAAITRGSSSQCPTMRKMTVGSYSGRTCPDQAGAGPEGRSGLLCGVHCLSRDAACRHGDRPDESAKERASERVQE